MLTTIAHAEDLSVKYHDAYQKAFNVFAETTPFPSVCGRVCPHPCEKECNRQYKDLSVGINDVERFIGDYALEHNFPVEKLTEEVKPQKVAIIGAGPAGLSCAYQLARRGYQSVVFEALPKAGGMLRYGIPDYRLPIDILDKEIQRIAGLGVEIRYNTRIGSDIQYDDLKKEFQAIFVGIGAHKGRLLGIPNEDAPNVYTGTEFLNKINSGNMIDIGKKVLVVGGGDTAIDAARISRRLGAEVTVVYRRTRNEMPAIDEEIIGAEEEGINFHYLAAPIEFIQENGQIVKMKCQKMELGEPDSSGRRRPVPIEGAYFDIDTTCVVAAISQEPDFGGLQMLREGREWMVVNDYFETKLENTFAGGDNVNLALVITAIRDGRLAAETIDKKFSGIPLEPKLPRSVATKDKMVFSFYQEIERNHHSTLTAEERLKELTLEITTTITEAQVIAESKRCLSCGDCFDCATCWSLCQDQVFVKPPFKTYEPYKMKLEVCIGCKKCAENCPCGFIEMVDPSNGQFIQIERTL
jgi:formate dehydrogenase major subunit